MTTGRQPFLAAVVQLCSTEDIEANVDATEAEIRKAAGLGARLITVPENFAFLRISQETPQPYIGLDHPIVARMQALAKDLAVDLVLGSIPEPSGVGAKVHNTSVYIGPSGEVRGAYRKLHLFDIDIPGRVTLKESDWITPGKEPVVVDGSHCRVGLSICYDLRFPELYRRLTVAGAKILTCPAAFTLHTGKDHWLPLLRARAIENQAYVMALRQVGDQRSLGYPGGAGVRRAGGGGGPDRPRPGGRCEAGTALWCAPAPLFLGLTGLQRPDTVRRFLWIS